jgi:hypothetical protein
MKLPNGWPQPAFLAVDDEGALTIEWLINGATRDGDWRVLFSYDPKEGPHVIVTRRDSQECEQEPAKVGAFLAAALDLAKGAPSC